MKRRESMNRMGQPTPSLQYSNTPLCPRFLLLPGGIECSYKFVSCKNRALTTAPAGRCLIMAIRTGADYIKALRDGREVWHGGRRIEYATTHAGFTGGG